MPIGRDQVEHAARLARLSLEGDDLDRLVAELCEIVDYVGLLESVEGGVDEFVLAPDGVTRPDTPAETLSQSEALSNARKTSGGSFEVPGFLPDGGSRGEDSS